MTNQTKFAYGASTVDGCKCPATAAGYDPADPPAIGEVPTDVEFDGKHSQSFTSREERLDNDHPGFARIADQYDVYVRIELAVRAGIDVDSIPDNIDYNLREKHGFKEGTIDAETARECFKKAVEVQDEWYAVEAGHIVLDALDWD